MLTTNLQAGAAVRTMLLGRLDPWPDELRGEETNAVLPRQIENSLSTSERPSSSGTYNPSPECGAIHHSFPARTDMLDSQPRQLDSSPAPVRLLFLPMVIWAVPDGASCLRVLVVAAQGSVSTVWQCSNSTWRPPSDT